eukprot:CAMPEP_0180552028 /NCGR_PEP_ID=MMETSP1036_2-20121128/73515_1 /TAXON_ID=632150 /ORGANISM="Azadinium spinosum, Strain 3D9" /LENGTH=60 /DNA_ID=CAMNT_0022567431 /DNA_START=281 /DNA_END=463 /DNA_ORIENTATION=-
MTLPGGTPSGTVRRNSCPSGAEYCNFVPGMAPSGTTIDTRTGSSTTCCSCSSSYGAGVLA